MSKIKSKNTTNNEKKNWVVATWKDIEEARQRGLYKAVSELPPKKKYELSEGHVDHFIWMVSERLEEAMRDWYKHGGDMQDETGEDYGLSEIERHLYMLEDLLPYRLQEKEQGDADSPLGSTGFNIGDYDLFYRLSKVGKRVAFPPTVKKFYQEVGKEDMERWAKSFICDVCGEKGANFSHGEMMTHTDCLAKHGWYQCTYCGWAYPVDVGQCKRKYGCEKGKIEKCSNKSSSTSYEQL